MKEKNLNLTESEKALVNRLFDQQLEVESRRADADSSTLVKQMRRVKRFDFRNKFLLSQPSHNFDDLTKSERADLSSVERKLREAAVRYESKALAFINRVIQANTGTIEPLAALPDGILGSPNYCSLAEALKPLAEDMRGDVEPETNLPSIEIGKEAGAIYMNDLPVVQLALSRDVRNFVALFDDGEYPHLVKDCRSNRWILDHYYDLAMAAQNDWKTETGGQAQ